jgi:hypothetical protein
MGTRVPSLVPMPRVPTSSCFDEIDCRRTVGDSCLDASVAPRCGLTGIADFASRSLTHSSTAARLPIRTQAVSTLLSQIRSDGCSPTGTRIGRASKGKSEMSENLFKLKPEAEGTNDVARLAEWAKRQELDLVRVPDSTCAERILGEIAVHAFDSPDLIKLFRQMSWSLGNDRRDVRIRLLGDEQSRAAFHAATKRLASIGYLARSSQRDDVFCSSIPSPGKGIVDGRLSQFLGGGWLEVGALALAREILVLSDVTLHPNVVVSSGDRLAEIDLLALPRDNGTALVVECKSGSDVEQHFLRFAAVSRLAGVSGPHAVLLVRGIDAHVAADASCIHDITVLTLEQFGAHLRGLFGIVMAGAAMMPELVAS